MTKPRRNAPIRTWEAGDLVQGFALLTKKEVRQDRNGKTFMDLELVDASGSMVGKVWNDSPHILNPSPPLNLDTKWFAPRAAYTLSKYA